MLPGVNRTHHTDSQKGRLENDQRTTLLAGVANQESQVLVQFNSLLGPCGGLPLCRQAGWNAAAFAALLPGQIALRKTSAGLSSRSEGHESTHWVSGWFSKKQREEQLENFTHEKQIR
jgi:hypothetical protein